MTRKTGVVFFMGFLVLAFSTAWIGCSSYGHGHNRYSHSRYDDAYRIGYDRGFEHGQEDRRAGLNFDYKHSNTYRHGISHDRHANDRFRDGYANGYKDAYYGRRTYDRYGRH